jgi:hypothetical protein
LLVAMLELDGHYYSIGRRSCSDPHPKEGAF